MKAVFLIFFLFFSHRGFGLCLPNSLNLNEKSFQNLLNFENLSQDIQEYHRKHHGDEYDLIFIFHALDSRINAEIRKKNQQLVLELFGGMLAHPKMNPNAFRLLVCHELGHAFGGPPMKSRTGWSSTEGQADYYSAKFCARNLLMSNEDFLEGALSLTSIYAEVMGEPLPELNQCDQRTVERTIYGYPSVQCRLETLLAGWEDGPRPSCWFRE